MPKIIPDRDTHAAFRELSVRFLREVKALHGVSTAETITGILKEHLGPQWAGQVTYDVLSETFPQAPRFVIHNVMDAHRIATVKAIRALMGNGLYEAKQLMEAALYGQEPIVITERIEGQTPEEMQGRANEFEQNMNNMGCRVSRYYGS